MFRVIDASTQQRSLVPVIQGSVHAQLVAILGEGYFVCHAGGSTGAMKLAWNAHDLSLPVNLAADRCYAYEVCSQDPVTKEKTNVQLYGVQVPTNFFRGNVVEIAVQHLPPGITPCSRHEVCEPVHVHASTQQRIMMPAPVRW